MDVVSEDKAIITLGVDFSNCDSPAKWLSTLAKGAKKFGLTYATLMHFPKPTDRFLGQVVIETNLPNKFITQMDELDFVYQSKNMAKFNYSLLPLQWTIDDLEAAGNLLPEIAQTYREWSIKGGIAFSFTSVTGERFLLGFDGNGPSLDSAKVNELLMFALTAFDHYQNLRRNALSIVKSLTKREIEVVRWTAQGKTSSEIASILSLSDHTVNAYMNNAIKKLECVNRTQLVAKAIRLKLIS